MKIASLLILYLNLMLIGCKQKTVKIKMLPSLAESDSASVMYYDTANNPRFFKYTKIRDIKIVTPVINEVNKETIEGRPDCATRGKIYFYGKGDAVYAVYFSDTEDCLTYSIIVTGEKYYFKMSKEVKRLLQDLQKIAVMPVVIN